METEQLIKSKQRVQDFAEVFTPHRIVSDMCDMIPSEMYLPDKTYLEPACGEGAFLLEVLRRKFKRCRSKQDYSTAIRSVYGFDLQADNVQITIENIIALASEYYRPTAEDKAAVSDHIIQGDGIKIMKLLSEHQK